MIVSPRWMPRPMPYFAPTRLELLDQRDRVEPLAVEPHRHAALELDLDLARRSRLVERAGRQHPGRLRNAALRVERLRAADRDAPEAAVGRVGGAARRHGQLALLEELHLRGPLPRVVAHGREDRELRRDGLEHDLEAHLVVAGGRAAVRDGVGAELLRELREVLRLQAALGADAKRVHVAAPHVAHDQELEDLVEELGRASIEPVLARAERARALVELPRRGGVDAAAVHGDRDDGAPVGLLEPRDAERRVEPAGEREHDRFLRDEDAAHVVAFFKMLSEPAAQPALLGRAHGRDEDRVVARQRADDLRPPDVVESDRDALRRADLGHDHEQVRPRGADLAHELGDDLQRLRVANLGRLRQAVAVLHLRRAEIPEIPAHARLRGRKTFLAQQLHELGLAFDRVVLEQAGNSLTPLVLFEGSARHGKRAMNKIAHIIRHMRKCARGGFRFGSAP